MVESVGSPESHEQRAAQEASEAMKAEISSLRAEIESIRSTMSDFGAETYETVKRRAGDAAVYVQEEATSMAGVIREHPATATTLMTLIGGIGFAIGYLVASASASAEQRQAWYHRYY
ncbi:MULTISPECIES: hypothetical protein [unclassified Rhizobium]|uniref:hypothetical protein n=1 Tax=unclassified Rhizobium TaxID=2613769 RepID=UPI003D27181D